MITAVRLFFEFLGAFFFASVCVAAAFGFWQAWAEHRREGSRDARFDAEFPELFETESTPIFDSVVDWERGR